MGDFEIVIYFWCIPGIIFAIIVDKKTHGKVTIETLLKDIVQGAVVGLMALIPVGLIFIEDRFLPWWNRIRNKKIF